MDLQIDNKYLRMNTSLPKTRTRFGILNLIIAVSLLLSLIQFPSLAGAQTAPRLAFITRGVPVGTSDGLFVKYLKSRGWDVALIDDDRIRDRGSRVVSGFDLVVVSSSVFPDRIQGRLLDAPEPIIVTEHELFPAFRMTERSRNNDWGVTKSTRSLQIVKPVHPMAAGLRGNVVVATKAKPMNFGVVRENALVIAADKDSVDRAVVFAYRSGARLFGNQRASGPRIGFYMTQKLPKFNNRDGWALFDAAAAWAVPNAPQPDNGPITFDPIAPETGTLLGGNVDKERFSSRYEGVRGFERQIGRQLDIVNRFHEFSAGLTSSFFYDRRHIEDGRTVMISWRATDNPGSVNGEPDPRRAKKIVEGRFDREIEAMAIALRDLEAPVLLRFNWEMDQDRGDPNYIGTPAEFKAAWRYVYRKFRQRGANNVEWVWAPRARSFAKDVGPKFYPGSDFVDWVGGSAVPINSFTDARTIYSAWNQWAVNIGKPQLLWLGVRENPNDARWKRRFIKEINSLAGTEWTGLKAFVYYNSVSPRGNDYTIDTSFNSLNAFRELACDPNFTKVNGC